jgi:hypothetical protein
MSILLYAALSIVAVNLFAAVVYSYLHRGAGLAISLVGTVLICIGLTYAALNDAPASKPAPDVTVSITATAPEQPSTVHPSLDPSAVSHETTPTARPTRAKPVQKKAPVARKHFDDMEKRLSHTGEGTDPGAGGCDDAAAGGCKR